MIKVFEVQDINEAETKRVMDCMAGEQRNLGDLLSAGVRSREICGEPKP